MKHRWIVRSLPGLAVTFTVLPTVPAWASVVSVPRASATTHKYKGPVVDMRWGPVQATVTIKGKKITDVRARVAPENERSSFIDDQSIPMLRQEILQAQSYKVNVVSGATFTSEAFLQSLHSALKKAHFKVPKA